MGFLGYQQSIRKKEESGSITSIATRTSMGNAQREHPVRLRTVHSTPAQSRNPLSLFLTRSSLSNQRLAIRYGLAHRVQFPLPWKAYKPPPRIKCRAHRVS